MKTRPTNGSSPLHLAPTDLDRRRAQAARERLGLSAASGPTTSWKPPSRPRIAGDDSTRSDDTPALALTVGGLRAAVRQAVTEARADDGVEAECNEVLTRKDVAALLRVDPHQISKLVRHGLPAHRLRRQLRFFRTDVLAWLRTNKEVI